MGFRRVDGFTLFKYWVQNIMTYGVEYFMIRIKDRDKSQFIEKNTKNCMSFIYQNFRLRLWRDFMRNIMEMLGLL